MKTTSRAILTADSHDSQPFSRDSQRILIRSHFLGSRILTILPPMGGMWESALKVPRYHLSVSVSSKCQISAFGLPMLSESATVHGRDRWFGRLRKRLNFQGLSGAPLTGHQVLHR